jgi:hypothetical protein
MHRRKGFSLRGHGRLFRHHAGSGALSQRVFEAVFHLPGHKDRKKVMNLGIQFQAYQNILVHCRDFLHGGVHLFRDVFYVVKVLQAIAAPGIRASATDCSEA